MNLFKRIFCRKKKQAIKNPVYEIVYYKVLTPRFYGLQGAVVKYCKTNAEFAANLYEGIDYYANIAKRVESGNEKVLRIKCSPHTIHMLVWLAPANAVEVTKEEYDRSHR